MRKLLWILFHWKEWQAHKKNYEGYLKVWRSEHHINNSSDLW